MASVADTALNHHPLTHYQQGATLGSAPGPTFNTFRDEAAAPCPHPHPVSVALTEQILIFTFVYYLDIGYIFYTIYVPNTLGHQAEGEGSYGLHLVRLLTFVPGDIISQVPYTPDLLVQVGGCVAKLNRTLVVGL